MRSAAQGLTPAGRAGTAILLRKRNKRRLAAPLWLATEPLGGKRGEIVAPPLRLLATEGKVENDGEDERGSWHALKKHPRARIDDAGGHLANQVRLGPR